LADALPRCDSPSHLLLLAHVALFVSSVCMWSISLSFSELVCDLLQRRLFHGSPKAHYRKVSHFDEHCLEDTGARRRRGFIPELPRATRSRPNFGRFVFLYSFVFKIPTCGGRKSTYIMSQVGVLRDFRRPQMGKMGIFPEETPEQTIPKHRKTRMAKK